MPDFSKMIKTVSSWHWGEASPGFNKRGEFRVQTADYLWIGESFATGNYTFAPTLAALYLVPSTLAGITLGFLWRGAAELMKKSYRN
jgi:hypothetical protein